ncbi:hypothetical protein CMI42_06505 [Candidatus Pacearchaeota archaeon]|nr:hypothetical protein [Candidatus Pacearchaeota archaeon]|tara:strand:+ start:3327 stop:4079 length:753 start_codon:yes stop_codon:yes gene_type:complete
MDTKLLQDIGLTEGETRVYLSLLKIGESTTGPLSKEAEVSSSKVYKILDRLIKKGLVGHSTKGKTKHFSALDPKRILDFMDDKEKEMLIRRERVRKLIPELEREQRGGKKPYAVVYEGFTAITNYIRGIIDELKGGEGYQVINANYGGDYPGLREFFYKFHKERSKRKINVKMLGNYGIRGKLEKSTHHTADIRYLPQQFIFNMQIFIYKNKLFIIVWEHKYPTAFLIESVEAVKGFNHYFNAMWKIAKK